MFIAKSPWAGSYCDAEKMLQTAQAKGLKLSIHFSTLFSNETKAASFLIDQGLLGRLYHARSVSFRRLGCAYVDGYGSPPNSVKYDVGFKVEKALLLPGLPEAVYCTASQIECQTT